MDFSRRTPQMLHEDHRATIEVIERLETMIAKARRGIPQTSDPSVRQALSMTAGAIEEEISTHFAFEETELFTRLEDAGDVGIGAHLRDEHNAILPLGQQVAAHSRDAIANGFTDQSWNTFRSAGAELIERMFAHIQKEEMALLPLLDDLLDPETDMELSTNYADSH